MNELETIKKGKFDNPVLEEMRTIVGKQTNNFANDSGITDVKYDMTATLEERGISKDDYIKQFGSINRSELDCVKNMVKLIGGSTTSNPDKERKKKLLQMKAKAALALLTLQSNLGYNNDELDNKYNVDQDVKYKGRKYTITEMNEFERYGSKQWYYTIVKYRYAEDWDNDDFDDDERQVSEDTLNVYNK